MRCRPRRRSRVHLGSRHRRWLPVSVSLDTGAVPSTTPAPADLPATDGAQVGHVRIGEPDGQVIGGIGDADLATGLSRRRITPCDVAPCPARHADRPRPRPGVVWDFPCPPRVEPSAGRVVVRFGGQVVAESGGAGRVLETSRPPVYYLPRAAFAGGCSSRLPAPRCASSRGRRGTSTCAWATPSRDAPPGTTPNRGQATRCSAAGWPSTRVWWRAARSTVSA